MEMKMKLKIKKEKKNNIEKTSIVSQTIFNFDTSK